ncbi:hypothetical protein ACW7G2_07545 [Luteimonas sp. A277]
MIRSRCIPGIVLAAMAWTTVAAQEHRVAPGPDCIDARGLVDVHQADAHTLAMRATDGTRALVELGIDCPGIVTGANVTTLGHGGWLCGAPGEAVRSGSRSCPIAIVRVVDTREYAEVVRRAREEHISTFDPVVVSAPRQRGFVGTTDYCLRVDALRGWQEDVAGLRVEVSPRRAGGNRHYRIETDGGCGNMTNAETLRLVSGMGLGMVCGNPGDRVVFDRAQPPAAAGVSGFPRPLMQGNLASLHGCRISRLYPIDR